MIVAIARYRQPDCKIMTKVNQSALLDPGVYRGALQYEILPWYLKALNACKG